MKRGKSTNSFVDHYEVLGLASGEEGARLSEREITKAYRSKARVLHPDKRRHDPNANANFVKLQLLMNFLFDDDLRKRWSKMRDSKRQKMISDLEKRERYSSFTKGAKDLETSLVLKEEIATINAMHLKKPTTAAGVRGVDGLDS